MNKQQHSDLIKQAAARLGFSYCGISKAEFLKEEAASLEQWLHKDMHGQMQYMANHFDKRVAPRKLVDNAQSVISLLYNYYTDKKQADPDAPKVSKYAYGEDYHLIIKKKLESLMHVIRAKIGNINGRVSVDSAPVLERAWAKRSGLGWIGKNTNLINKNNGSYFFIAELIIDLPLEYDSPMKDYCGSCTKCIDACPTDAIVKPYIVDGSKCIAYFTIELKDAIPNDMAGKFKNWIFGCDICQEACPWNSFSVQHREAAFDPKPAFLNMSKQGWEEITEEVFNSLFKRSPLKRAKYAGIKKNMRFLRNNK